MSKRQETKLNPSSVSAFCLEAVAQCGADRKSRADFLSQGRREGLERLMHRAYSQNRNCNLGC